NNIGPSRASGLEAGVEVLKGLFELRPHVARADDVALCVACQLAGDVDGLTWACDRDDVRIGGLPLLYADVHARRLDPVDLHGHNSSSVADVHQRRGCGYDPGYCNRAKLRTLGIPEGKSANAIKVCAMNDGYARVSTRDQDLASQVAALQTAGCGNIFKEKASGAKTDRPELAKAIRRLEAGDVLVVTRLDRLARSTRD